MPNTRKTHSYVEEWRRSWEPDLDAIGFNGATCDPTQVDPKVLDWIKEHCGDHPHFVKVINRNAAHGQPGLLARSSGCMVICSLCKKLSTIFSLKKNSDHAI
jgi:hypothetical protein